MTDYAETFHRDHPGLVFTEDEGHEYDDLPRHNYPRAFLLVGVFAVIVGVVVLFAVTR